MTQDEQIITYVNHDNLIELKKLCLTEPPIPLWNIRGEKDSTLLDMAIFSQASSVFGYLISYLQKHLSKEELSKYINHENNQKVSAIHLASLRGNIKMIQTLIQHGANITVTNRTGLNVLHYASQGNQPNSLAFFLEYYNMNIEETDEGQGTPLHWACYSGSEKAALFLIINGVNMNKVDKHGYTALHLAVVAKKLKVIKKLIQYGIDYTIKDKKEMTAKDLAKSKGLNDIGDFLAKAEKCNACSFTSIIKKTKCNYMNIVIITMSEVLSLVCFFFVLFPCIWCQFKIESHLYIYLSMTLLFFMFYLYLIFGNPGLLPSSLSSRDNSSNNDDANNKDKIKQLLEQGVDLKRYCMKCLVEIKENSKHCIICEKCIDGFDHHCFWINNCIGKSNQKFFLFFLIYSVLNSIMMIILDIIALIYSGDLSIQQLEGYFLVINNTHFLYSRPTQLSIGLILLALILFFLVELLLLIKLNFKSYFNRLMKTNIGPLSDSFLQNKNINGEDEQQ